MRTRWARTAALAACSVVVLGGCAVSDSARASEPTRPDSAGTPVTTTSTAAPAPVSPATTATADDGTALALLGTLPVKGRAPRTGYDRDLFGHAWADTDRNGCDTRNDVLRRDLAAVQLKGGTNGCVVLSGTLADPFSGEQIVFQRGQGTSELVQIDHVVPLSDAWQKGAQQWRPERRVAFANDPLNLLAVDGSLNQAKSDGDAATWLPPNKGFRCAYVARQVAVKAKYGAWVTAAEHDAIARVLSDCPGQRVPTSDAPVAAPGAVSAPNPAPAPAAAPAVTNGSASGCDPAYPDVCIPPVAQAGDLDCGDVTYRRFRVLPPDPHRFDREGDGLGCES